MNLLGKKVVIVLRGVVDERSKKLARALAQSGANVVIFSFTFSRSEQTESAFTVRYFDSVEPRGSIIAWRPLRIIVNLSLKRIQQAINTLRQGIFGHKNIAKVIVQESPDLIISINADTLAGVAQAAEELGVLFTYESFEFWPDYAQDPALRYSVRQRRFAIESEKKYAQQAALFVTVSEYLATEYKKELNLSRTPDIVYNAPTKPATKASPSHKPLRVLFLGNIVPERNIEFIMDSIDKVAGVELYIQGDGYHKGALVDHLDTLKNPSRVHFAEPVPYVDLAQSISDYDVGVISYEVYNRHVDGALPNKFFEYMSGGLAEILTKTSAFSAFPHIHKFSVFIDPSQSDSLVKVLENLRDNSMMVQNMKNEAFRLSQQYCGEALNKVIVSLYEKIER